MCYAIRTEHKVKKYLFDSDILLNGYISQMAPLKKVYPLLKCYPNIPLSRKTGGSWPN